MTKTYIKEAFDLGITRTSGTKVGMMLAQDKNGNPLYQVFRDAYLATQYFTGAAGYGSVPAEKELAIRQDDWRAGFGQEVYNDDDPYRYYSSIGMDMRFMGMMIAGPTSTGIAMPAPASITPTITNANMEATTGWTTGARNATQAHGGTYSWLVGIGFTAYQDAATWDNSWRGRRFTFTCWVYSNSSAVKIQLEDGVTTWSSTAHTGGSTWEQLSISATLGPSAIRLRLHLNVPSGAAASYYDDAAISSANTAIGACTARADFNDVLYLGMGRYLYKLNGTGNGFTFVQEFAASITSLAPFTDDVLYIAIGTSNAYWYMSTAEVFTESTTTSNKYQFLVVVNTTAPTMYGNDAGNKIRSTTNPANGGTAWSAQTTVGEAYNAITSLLSHSGALYIMKEDKPYYLNSSGQVQHDLAPELSSITSSRSGKNAHVWLDLLYIPAGLSALLEIGTANTWRSPSIFATNLADFSGEVFALASDEQYLFAIVNNVDNLEILSGRQETIGSTTKWVWHPIHELTMATCEFAFVSPIYQKRLWIASTSSSDALYYIPLPTSYANILADANRTFKTGSTMETPFMHGNFKDTNKAFPELKLVMGHAYDADIYFTVKYKKMEDTTWTTIGNYTGSATSMVQSRFIPVDASSVNPVSTLFKLQFTAVTDDTSKTPKLLSFHLKGLLRPPQREIIACVVRVADEVVMRDGLIDKGSHDELVATLNEAMTATWPVTINDINGDAKTVNFLPVNPYWKPVRQEKNRRTLEREYNCLMQVVDLS